MRSRKSRLVLFLGGNGICDRGLALALGGIRAVGLNATDTKCIGLILSHPDPAMTAGDLAEKPALPPEPLRTFWTDRGGAALSGACVISGIEKQN